MGLTNLKILYSKFTEMFPLLAEEVGGYKAGKEAGSIFLLSKGPTSRVLYKFTYTSDSKWSLERF